MIRNFKNRITPILLKHKYPITLMVLILLCLWPLSFFVYIPKWDNINGYLPYRYFISDFLWNGHLPLWNPFQRLGYPGYSDLQSGCWSPITWVIMFFGKYTIGSLIVELLSYYVIAGLGMYKLGNYFYKNPKTSFIIGLCYALSGFMVGSSQLMVFIIGVAWLPWCIYSILQFLTTLKVKYAFLTALFIAISTSAVSPAYTIMLVYIFIFIFLYFLWKNKQQKTALLKILKGGVIILVCSVLLLLPYLNSFIEFSPYFNRIDKLPYGKFLLSNPFTFIDYISFVFPYTIISSTDIFNLTDLSLRNGYFGIAGFLFFLVGLFTVKNKYQKILIAVFFVSLILAAGSETFIYKWIYHLPGFGIFRHPSFFRTYTIFSALLISGFVLNNVFKNNEFNKLTVRLMIGLVVLFIGVAGYSFVKSSGGEIIENLLNVIHFQEISTSSIFTHLFINAFILLLLFLLVFCAKKLFNLSLFMAIAIFVVLDLGIQTSLTAPTTIVYNFTYSSVANYFKELPNEINQNDNKTPLKYLDETQGLKSVNGIWQNVSTFNKTLSRIGVNPMRFKSFDEGKENGALERNVENEILFFPSKEFHIGDTLQKGLIWGTSTPIYIESNRTKIESVTVGYNEFIGHVSNSSEKAQWLLLNQNYHHLWGANYEEKSLPIQKVNDMIMGVEIPAKTEGKIQFVFKSPRTKYFFIVSLLSYLAIFIYLIKTELK